jgi:hypothetical protein
MKKFTLLLFLSTALFSLTLHAQLPLVERDQEPQQERFIDRMFFGGVLGLQFGSSTYIEVAPIVGYNITPRFAAGLGLKYIYYKYKDPYNMSYSSSEYGGGPFVRYFIFEGLFLHAEYEALNVEVPEPPYYINYSRQFINSVFLGGGYRQMIGARSSLDFLILYNINESIYSPYPNPIFRIGFGFGI